MQYAAEPSLGDTEDPYHAQPGPDHCRVHDLYETIRGGKKCAKETDRKTPPGGE